MSDTNLLSPLPSILAPLDTGQLESEGWLLPRSPHSPPGTRQIHKRRLNSSSDDEYGYLPLSPPESSPDAYVTIPDILISRETLVYIGLSNENADEKWDQWTNWPQYGPPKETDAADEDDQVSFFDFILGPIKRKDDTIDETDQNWHKCMDDCGISTETQNAIMDKQFTYLRLSQSCLYWVVDTISMRYAGLEDIQRSSLAREMKLRRTSLHPNPHRSQTPHAHSGRDRGRSISGEQQRGTPGIELDIWSSAQAESARNAPGHTALFKGVDQARIHGLFDDFGNLADYVEADQRKTDRFRSKAARILLQPRCQGCGVLRRICETTDKG